MRFTHCLLVTFLGFVAIYVARLDFRRVTDFDAGPPAPASVPQPAVQVKQVAVARRPVTMSASNQSTKQRTDRPAAAIEPSPPPVSESPQVEQRDGSVASRPATAKSTPRDGTHGSASISLEVVIEGPVGDHELQLLLWQEDCKVVVVKVEGTQVVEAFLPDRHGELVRTFGAEGTRHYEAFRQSHPTNRHVWFRWHDIDHGIGNIARTCLRRLGVQPDEYYVYLVLSRELSAEVQRLLVRKAAEKMLDLQDVGYGQVSLYTDRSRLRAEVLQVLPRQEASDEAEPTRQSTDTADGPSSTM